MERRPMPRAQGIVMLLLLAAGGCGDKSAAPGLGTGAPCVHGSDCQTGICGPIGADSMCGIGCDSAASCTAGWTCAPLAGASTQACQCNPTSETCDGADNDCDGVVDNATDADGWCTQQVAGQHCDKGACACPK